MFFDYKTDALRYDEGLSSLESERDDSGLFISESGAFFHKWKRCKIFLGENRTHPHNIVELNTCIAVSSCTTKELKIAHLENLYILKEKENGETYCDSSKSNLKEMTNMQRTI